MFRQTLYSIDHTDKEVSYEHTVSKSIPSQLQTLEAVLYQEDSKSQINR